MLQQFDELKVHIPNILNIKKKKKPLLKKGNTYKYTNTFSDYFGDFLTAQLQVIVKFIQQVYICKQIIGVEYFQIQNIIMFL